MSVIVIILLVAFVSPFVYISQHKDDLKWFKRRNPQKQRLYLIDKYLKEKPTRDWTIAFKGFHKDMTCRNFQYKEGCTYHLQSREHPRLCIRGFHACLFPTDCYSYYSRTTDVYHIVFLKDIDPHRDIDSKICSEVIHIGPKIDRKYIQG